MTSANPPENPLRRYSDAARRISDIVGMHLQADFEGAWNKWAAFSLHDGTSDNNVYPDAPTAARHQLTPEYCLYVQMVDHISPREAETLLNANRQAYNAGYRTDPDTPIVVGNGAGANLLLPMELKTWNQSGLILPPHLRPKGRTRR